MTCSNACYDRIIVTGTLPGACYAKGMTGFLFCAADPDLRLSADIPEAIELRTLALHGPARANAGRGRGERYAPVWVKWGRFSVLPVLGEVESAAASMRARVSYCAALMAAGDWRLAMARTRPGDKPTLAGAVSKAFRVVGSILRAFSLLAIAEITTTPGGTRRVVSTVGRAQDSPETVGNIYSASETGLARPSRRWPLLTLRAAAFALWKRSVNRAGPPPKAVGIFYKTQQRHDRHKRKPLLTNVNRRWHEAWMDVNA
jgi:hypothetical protein